MIKPDWPAPTWIHALTTTRQDGNFGHCPGADPIQVAQHRAAWLRELGLNTQPMWLNQVHGNQVIEALVSAETNNTQATPAPDADGVWTQQVGLPCAILTADCLPLIICDESGTIISALHCGWRGLAQDIIQKAVDNLRPKAQGNLIAWMGPAIGPAVFEVGQDVYTDFVSSDVSLAQAFRSNHKPGKWLADIYQIARLKCRQAGITTVYGGEYCTYSQPNNFYSYRREPQAGRLLTLVWIGSH